MIWPHLFGGCQLRRPTGQYLVAAGKWEKLEVKSPTPEDAPEFVPKVTGRLIKSASAA